MLLFFSQQEEEDGCPKNMKVRRGVSALLFEIEIEVGSLNGVIVSEKFWPIWWWKTEMWDVGSDAFNSMDDVGYLQLENELILDNAWFSIYAVLDYGINCLLNALMSLY